MGRGKDRVLLILAVQVGSPPVGVAAVRAAQEREAAGHDLSPGRSALLASCFTMESLLANHQLG